MEGFVKGDVVVVPFPFSDLTNAKRRPALVVTPLTENDVILCQITSGMVKDKYSIPLTEGDFTEGALKRDSNIRPNRIFTADRSIIRYKIGHLSHGKIEDVIEKMIEIIRE